jgi:membrane fusion protein, heavy metal efflux system
MMKYYYYFLFVLVLISACQVPVNESLESGDPEYLRNSGDRRGNQHRHRSRGGRGHAEQPAGVHTSISGDTVFVPEGSSVHMKLKMQTVNTGEYSGLCYTTGVVKPVAGHLAEVSTPFGGRIVKSFVSLGQKVNRGTPLFEVSSSDYIESVRLFLQAKRQREMTEINLTRKKDLLESGITSRKEFDEARLEFDLADKEYEKSAEILRIYNINPDEPDLTRPLMIRAPISGEIVKNDVTVGQYINADSEPIVTIADLDRIWIVANAREKDLGKISLRDKVNIITESHPNDPIAGSVHYIGNMMNEQTRSVEVYIESENRSHILKPGMFVSVCFSHRLKNALLVPSGSVMQEREGSYIFVRADDGVYVKRRVSVTPAENNSLVVLSGLESGSTVISEGGIFLQ